MITSELKSPIFYGLGFKHDLQASDLFLVYMTKKRLEATMQFNS